MKKLLKAISLLALIWALPILATSMYDGNDCVKCGPELPYTSSELVELSELDIALVCQGHKAQELESVENEAKKIFGSVEEYYENLHRFQCPPNYPSPIYIVVEEAPYLNHLYEVVFNEHLPNISEQNRLKLLNRPRTGLRNETILDLVERSLERSRQHGDGPGERVYTRYRDRIIEMGGKRLEDLTPQQLAQYQ